MKKTKRFFAYIYFFPLSLIFAILISGTVSVIQNLFNYFTCTFSLLPTWFLSNYTACDGVYNKRTFFADVAFCIVFIQSIEFFIPTHKKQAKLIATISLSLFFVVILAILFLYKIFNEDTLNCFVMLIGLVIYSVMQINEITKKSKE